MPNLFRCQVVLKHSSGLPRDNVTNTFWTVAPAGAPTAAQAEAVAEMIRDFYVSDPDARTTAIMNYLNNSLLATGHEVKVTPIDEATGHDTRGLGFPPLWTETFDFLGWAAPAVGLPNEVACCLSFKNTTDGAAPPPQRRGRIYIGPLGTTAQAASAAAWRPNPGFRGDLLIAAGALRTALTAAARSWVIYSRPFAGRDEVPRPGNPRGPLPALAPRAGVSRLVTDFWVDNAFDTQRKRGERATLRSVGT